MTPVCSWRLAVESTCGRVYLMLICQWERWTRLYFGGWRGLWDAHGKGHWCGRLGGGEMPPAGLDGAGACCLILWHAAGGGLRGSDVRTLSQADRERERERTQGAHVDDRVYSIGC